LVVRNIRQPITRILAHETIAQYALATMTGRCLEIAT
jgi:hypothetical protein